jgi:hypothetical protein
MVNQSIIEWLLEGDVSIQYQVYRDLLEQQRPDLKVRISLEGWGARFLSLRKDNGHWGMKFYQPKWTSTHYTLLDLRNLCIDEYNPTTRDTVNKIIEERTFTPKKPTPLASDICLNGMFLNYASYFKTNIDDLRPIVDYILSQHMADGGFNCAFIHGATHASVHSTLSVMEGIQEYTQNGYTYRLDELKNAELRAREFLLEHRLYKSHRTGNIMDKKMLLLSYPSRWRYDILKALDYFRYAKAPYDPCMSDALEVLCHKRRSDEKWPLQAKHPGAVHFDMETAGEPSRWNTLRALRVLKHFNV